jgi:tartrate dehydratase alpha subunit/fumarate hydratase class I-like protein
MPTVIKQADFVASIADAFQFISHYHPADYLRSLHARTNGNSRPRRRTRWRSS